MIFQKYQIVEKIAQGGSAEVFCAVQSNDMGFHRQVAIKRMLQKHVGSLQYENMLVNEAKLLVTLNHPNIVKVHDLGCDQGIYFFVMEYVKGLDLRGILTHFYARNERMPLENAVLAMAEVCKALDYIHRKRDASGKTLNLVHMDISPKNILISWSGEVKLTDFGISHFQRDLCGQGLHQGTKERVVRGKFGFMSPEQAQGRPVDGRSDLFSLGLIFYELLSAKRFYQCRQLVALQQEHKQKPVQAPLFDADIPSELEYIVLRCLAYDPNDRYGSAREIYRDLFRILYQQLGTIPHHQLSFMMDEINWQVREKGKSMTDATPKDSQKGQWILSKSVEPGPSLPENEKTISQWITKEIKN